MFSIKDTANSKSKELLQKATHSIGILASIIDETNYKRVWARDSVICGLAGLMLEDEQVMEGLKQSIYSLGKEQAKHGQIPSNIAFDESGKVLSKSFGGLCGRVDNVTWWIIGLCNYTKLTGDQSLLNRFEKEVEKGINILEIWEYNDRGLVYVPQSGNWADEYVIRGYTLYDQLLRLWALRCAAGLYERVDWHQKAEVITDLIKKNYWISKGIKNDLYHEHAYELTLKKEGISQYWAASFSPGGYFRKFDLIANGLTFLLDINTKEQSQSILNYTNDIIGKLPFNLLPSFWEPIQQGDEEWYLLEANHKYDFRNIPFDFQNGGIWPCFNGFWGMCLLSADYGKYTKVLEEGLCQAVQQGDWAFYECINGQSGETSGTKYCTWSAAGVVLFQQAMEGKRLFVG